MHWNKRKDLISQRPPSIRRISALKRGSEGKKHFLLLALGRTVIWSDGIWIWGLEEGEHEREMGSRRGFVSSYVRTRPDPDYGERGESGLGILNNGSSPEVEGWSGWDFDGRSLITSV
jgi:hypothetical protein